MSSRLLSISLGLNLILLGFTGYWAASSPSSHPPMPAKNRLTEKTPELTPPVAEVVTVQPVHWSELESEDYPTYVANLRKAGCPEPVLRRIIEADLKELYAQKAFTLTQEFHRDFWKIAAVENIREYFERTLGPQIKALAQTPDAVLQELLGQAPHAPTTNEIESLSTEESADAAKELQHLYGVDFTETELRKMAQVIEDYHHRVEVQDETDPETLDQKLQAALGSARFADLNRARAASYREIYEVTANYGLPSETAAEIFDLRLESEKQCDEVRADKNRTAEEKQTLLDNFQEQVEQAMLDKFGAPAYQTYKARNGRWISALGNR